MRHNKGPTKHLQTKKNAKDPKGHPNPLVRCLVEFFLPCFNKSSIVGDSFNLIQAQILVIWHTSICQWGPEKPVQFWKRIATSSWVWHIFLQGTYISPFRKRKLIFNISFPGDMLVPQEGNSSRIEIPPWPYKHQQTAKHPLLQKCCRCSCPVR